MAIKKYINTSEVVELTGCTISEVLNLAKTGVLSAHKTRRGHWRFSVDAVEKYFGIQVNKSEEKMKGPEEQAQYLSEMRLITEDFYKEVIKRICAAKSSIKIMTADINLIRLKPTASQGNKYKDGTPIMDILVEKAKKGVSVQIISSEKSAQFQEEVERAYCKSSKKPFFVCFCARNHAKVVIIDDRFAYMGSANMTRAGLGQPYNSPGNFEVGILTEDSKIIASLNDFFSRITNHEFCEGCHRQKHCTEDKF